MKRINFLILLVISNFLYSQNKQFIYEYKYIPDSTNVKNILTENKINVTVKSYNKPKNNKSKRKKSTGVYEQ